MKGGVTGNERGALGGARNEGRGDMPYRSYELAAERGATSYHARG